MKYFAYTIAGLLLCTTSFAQQYGTSDKTYTEKSRELAKESIKAATSGKTGDAYRIMQHSVTHFTNGVKEDISGNGNNSKCPDCRSIQK